MKRTFYRNIVLVLKFILLVNNVSLSQNAIITGRVKYGNEVLPGATVSLGHESAIAGQDGKFSFSIKPGKYKIIITHAGYEKLEQTVIARAGHTRNFNFHLALNDLLQEVMIGSRSKTQRSYLNTPVPIDFFSGQQLIETGQITITQMMNFLSPSSTVSREVLNEPVTLRGLDPQHVLILINGIRYHPMAWLFNGTLKGQLGKGSVGNDLNSIPFPAIEKIEVLRDGAAAQYGSDAIAGVINIKLKNTQETSFDAQLGQFYKGDGRKITAGLYHGWQLKKKNLPGQQQGFMSFSAFYRNQAATFRGAAYEGLVYLNYPANATSDDSINIKQQDEALVKSRRFNRSAAIDNAGNTQLVSKGISINSGYPINERMELFMTTLVNSRKLDRGAFFRLPRDSARINYILYPDGVQPRNKSNTVDVSTIIGIRGKTRKELNWDIVTSYGSNSVRNSSTDSYNETQTLILRENAQTSFYNGTDMFRQLTNDVNFSKQILPNTTHLKMVNLAFGTEWRVENYQKKLGEEASRKNFDTVNYRQFAVQGAENVTNKSRDIIGTYVEMESEFNNSLLFTVAGRYEYHSDFGANVAGKLAARYRLSPKFLLRASVNNGFRAPSLQQRFTTSISYRLNSRRETIIGGTFPNTHEVVRALDVPLLTAEKSININGGFTSTVFNNINLTVDAYWIRLKNRIVVSGNFDRARGSTLDAILDLYPQFHAVNQISFFSNAINTITKGVDIVLDGYWGSKKDGLGVNVAANFNSTHIYGRSKTSDKLSTIAGSSNTIFNSEDSTRIERGQPGSKIILFITYKTGNTKLMIRNTRFGKTVIAPFGLRPESFSPKILTDVSVAYSLRSLATLTIGANNIGNVYPDRLKNYENTSQGSWMYSPEASPFGFNGGYYYLSIALKF